MKYPCSIIKDLLPLYIDDVLSSESQQAVTEHLAECDSCQKEYQQMQANEDSIIACNICKEEEDRQMADSLKKIKNRLNRNNRRIMLCAACAVLALCMAYEMLFCLPLKTVSPDDVQITAGSYKLQDLPYNLYNVADGTADGKVTISLHEYESREPTYRVEIPAIPDTQISVTEDMLNTGGYVSMVSITSKYRLDTPDWDINGDTMYIRSFKTTLLGGRSGEKTVQRLEFRPVNKIVLINDDGTEKIMWENAQ